MAFIGKNLIPALLAAAFTWGTAWAESAPVFLGEPYRMKESEFRDLREYLDRAQEILTKTLKTARSMGGTLRHDELLRGLRAALQEGSPTPDLLLFRTELERTEELDAVFTKSNDPRAVMVAASAVLIPGLQKALEYYRTDDDPRTKSIDSFLPEWADFARNQIPIWLRTADFAPEGARTEIVLRALGWTAKALNKSTTARRTMGSLILALADMEASLEGGKADLPHAQQLLLKVSRKLAGPTATPAAKIEIPIGVYPGL